MTNLAILRRTSRATTYETFDTSRVDTDPIVISTGHPVSRVHGLCHEMACGMVCIIGRHMGLPVGCPTVYSMG